MDLKSSLHMAKQMRWREAHKATPGKDCEHAREVIRLHNLVIALEAAAKEGEPEMQFASDIDGYPLDPSAPNY